MTQKRKDILIVGFALFAMFFGAGNLIFPPALGQGAGVQVVPAILGFLLTGVGLPLLGIIAVSKSGGDLESLASKVNSKFGRFLACGVILTLGPLVAIPRTSATTYEMAIAPFFPNFNPIIFSAIYFMFVLIFVLKPSSLIDNIGKVLTPVLLLTMITIIAKGVLQPQGILIDTGINISFSNGFSEGYQTMDAMGATILGGIIIGAIRAKGYTKTKEISEITVRAGMVAAAGLAIIYGGLAYLGATAGDLPMDLSRPELIIQITNNLLGTLGQGLLGVAVGMACLTTSIGLTATAGEFFSKASNGKLGYKAICIATAVVSMGISNMGVDRIITFAEPILLILYPMIIVLVALAFLDKHIKSAAVYKGAVFSTVLISVIDVMGTFILPIPVLTPIVQGLPLSAQGFGWIFPAVLIGMLFYVRDHYTNYTKKKVEYTH
ncbi:branched-chain amino acid transport system II carrier protein [Proteinivorax hydrogeniformans]|uniref:Branched-chain amino acid transport system carrier protein n=1 Tax=Proteinivorax hydrogeniformans TaxID=1826727 RepID=A0AAU8HUL3_9FIRM